MRLGPEAMEALQAEITGKLKTGDDLVVAGPVGLEGTIQIIKEREEFLKQYFSTGFLYELIRLEPEIRGKLPEQETDSLYEMGKGGVLAALWKMAEVSQIGLKIDLRKIPIRQETIEVCEIFDLNPYKLQSDGAILIGIRGGEALVQRLRNEGFMAEIIGQTNSGNDRLLYSGGSARYLERPAEDELYRIIDMESL